MEKKLHRIPEHAVFGGVASGIAQYLHIDVIIIRVLFVVMLILPIPPSFGWTGILYIILWAVLPVGSAGATYPVTGFGGITDGPTDPFFDKKRSDQTIMILGGVLVFFGAVMLLDDLPVWYQFKKYFWPLLLIIIGAFLILRQRDKEHENGTTVYPTTPPPVEPIDPEPQPYTPFTPPSAVTTSSAVTHYPQNPDGPTPQRPEDGDDPIIRVN